MPNQAVNHYRRTLLKGLGAATLLSPLASIPSFAAAPRRLYVDGLSFLPDDLGDVTAAKLDAIFAIFQPLKPCNCPMVRKTISVLIKPVWKVLSWPLNG